MQPRRALERWTWSHPLPQGNDLHQLACGNGCYVALGDQRQVLWSSNAVSWQSVPVLIEASALGFLNGEFIALIDPNANALAYVSADGLHWRVREASALETSLLGAAYGQGLHARGAAISPDGMHWRAAAPEPLTKVAFGNGCFVGIYRWAPPGGAIWTSPDGIAWYVRNTGVELPLRGLAFGNGLFVAVGEDGVALTSPDGFNWTSRGRIASRDVNDLVFDGRQFVACGNRGLLLTSPDGLVWTVRAGELDDLFGVTYAGSQFVAVGDQGRPDQGICSLRAGEVAGCQRTN